MKKLRLALIAVAVALLGLPPVFGFITQNQVTARVESLRANDTLTAAIESYDRGWFTSTALISIDTVRASSNTADRGEISATDGVPLNPVALLLDAPLSVVVDFSHGPVSLRDGFFLGASEFVARPEDAAEGAAASPYPFEFRGQTTFAGELHFLAHLPPLYRETEELTVSFSGGRASGTVTGRRIAARAEADSMQITGGPATLSMQGIVASADYEVLSRSLVPGVFDLTAARAALDPSDADVDAATSLFDGRGVTLRTRLDFDADQNRLDGALELAVDSARIGSDTRIARGRFDGVARNLDAAAVESIRRVYESYSGLGAPSLEELHPAIARLLAAGPSVSVNPLRFDMNGAPFEATLLIETDPASLPPTAVLDLGSPALWYALVDGRIEVVAEKRLVERFGAVVAKELASSSGQELFAPSDGLDKMAVAQANFVLAMLAAQGMIEDTGILYRTTVRLQDGRLEINGQPLPFELPR